MLRSCRSSGMLVSVDISFAKTAWHTHSLSCYCQTIVYCTCYFGPRPCITFLTVSIHRGHVFCLTEDLISGLRRGTCISGQEFSGTSFVDSRILFELAKRAQPDWGSRIVSSTPLSIFIQITIQVIKNQTYPNLQCPFLVGCMFGRAWLFISTIRPTCISLG